MELKHLKTFEQFTAKAEVVEEGFLDKLAGVKDYILDDKFVGDATSDKFIKEPRYAKNVTYLKGVMQKHLGMDEVEADRGVTAVAKFTKGATPLLNKYNITFDKATKKLVIDPNGKGLFNGHPIMG